MQAIQDFHQMPDYIPLGQITDEQRERIVEHAAREVVWQKFGAPQGPLTAITLVEHQQKWTRGDAAF